MRMTCASQLSDFHDLLHRLLEYLPEHRLTASAAMQHPFVLRATSDRGATRRSVPIEGARGGGGDGGGKNGTGSHEGGGDGGGKNGSSRHAKEAPVGAPTSEPTGADPSPSPAPPAAAADEATT